jgi:hypothetical protein
MKIDVPTITARFSPVYWEPMVGSNERITVMIAIEPELGKSNLIPAVHLVLPPKRLKAMLGIARGNSAFGILNNAAEFMTSRLAAGLALEELDAPFGGFTVGQPRSIRGYSEDQILSGAVQMVSALGDVDDLLEGELGETRLLATTIAFLKSVQAAFSADIKERKNRFFKVINQGRPDAVTIDYAHKKWLIQFTSLPSTLGQTPYMIREAESKILELITAQQFVESETKPVLIINRQPILQISGEIQKAADHANERFKLFAERHKVESIEIDSKMQAVNTLESFA